MKKNVLVTGSTGFVGRYFVKNHDNFNITEVDLLTQDVEKIVFSDIDSILHLAGLVHQMKGASEEQYFKVNRDLAFQVAKTAKANGVKHFVLMSTAKVYGESSISLMPWDENSSCNPLDFYSKSKFEAENIIRSLEDNNFKVAIIRSPLVYGSGVKANMFKLIRLIDRYPVLPLGGIQNKRSVVFVGNLTSLINQIINKLACGIFIAGDNAPLSTTQLVKLIAESLDKRIWLIRVPGFVVKNTGMLFPSVFDRLLGSFELDNKKTNEKLQFTPPYSSAEGIHEMVTWYKASLKQ